MPHPADLNRPGPGSGPVPAGRPFRSASPVSSEELHANIRKALEPKAETGRGSRSLQDRQVSLVSWWASPRGYSEFPYHSSRDVSTWPRG